MSHQPSQQPDHRSAGQPREIELKLTVPAASVDALLAHPVLQAAAPPDRRREVTVYFDTPDQALAQHGMSLRIRHRNDRRIQTLKLDRGAGVAADRGEWEWPVEQDEPDLHLLRRTPAADKLPRRTGLAPVVTSEIDRTVRLLKLPDSTVIEAAFDEGVIAAGDTRQPVRELELELREGDPAALYRLALQLHSDIPLTVESESKAARGDRLRSGAKPAAHRTEAVELEPTASAALAFRRILSAELGHLLANRPAARAGDAEGVHQMRVAVRRLRAALTLFQPHLEPHTAALFQDELRRLGRVFGEARDWDVFCLQTLPETLEAADAAGWRDLLLEPATEAREIAHRRFEEQLEAPSFTALVLGLAAWAEQRNLLGDAELDRPIKDVCAGLLDRLARKVERRGRHIAHRSDAERHALRKSLKKLRYGIEYLQAVFSSKPVHAYLHGCKDLQQSLGDMNDAVTATALADLLVDGTRPDLAPAAGALAEQLGRRREHALHHLERQWHEFRAEPRFWA
ncbi:MAG TPA: CHAD domain-containing protein [Rhodopila sp.]